MPHEQPFDIAEPSVLQDLLLELEQIMAVIRNTPHCDSEGASRLALVRLVDNFDQSIWSALSARYGLDKWLALPLDKNQGEILRNVQETLEALSHQRDHDVLTGLGNRRLFDRHLHLELGRAQRTKSEISLVMLDLDDFKKVNDSYGHKAGDQVLMRLGEVLRSSLRGYDVAVRIGGEEFCLILPGASSLQARTMAERVLEIFRQERFDASPDFSFSVTCSAGVSTAHGHLEALDATALLAKADEALYLAKHQGKDRVVTMSAPHLLADSSVLVHVAEKKFLFSGSV